MTLVAGQNGVIQVNDVDLSAYVTGITVDLKGKSLVDVTAMGDAGKTWASDKINDVTVTVDFLFDMEAGVGAWDILEATWDGDQAYNFHCGLNGASSATIIGTAWMESIPVAVVIGDMVRMNGVVFKVVGAPAVTPT